MGAAEKLKTVEPADMAPDMSKPVRLKYWRCVDTLGVLTQRDVTLGAVVNDGSVQGRVKSIWFFPSSGFCVAEIEVGWRPGVLDEKQEIVIQRLIMTNGHGREV
jgi:hypothetical protein